MLFKWTPNFVPNKIIIFGCGGTGSRVAPLVAQFVKSCPWVLNPEIMLIDFDVVEEKNLFRQNFIASDVGKNKAAVLAARYSKAFGINITPIAQKVKMSVTTEEEREAYSAFSSVARSQNRVNNLFIICVDTPEARREIVEMIEYICGDYSANAIIDAGNENDFGQVTIHGVCGATVERVYAEELSSIGSDIPVDCDIPFIPMDSEYYDTMVSTTVDSCATLDQSMAINCLMAINIFAIIQNIYYVKPLNFFRINISLQHGAIPEYISARYFDKISKCKSDGKKQGVVYYRMHNKSLSREIGVWLDNVEKFKQSMLPKEKPKGVKKIMEEAVVGPSLTAVPYEIIGSASNILTATATNY